MNRPIPITLILAAFACMVSARADLQYYLPFEVDNVHSLTNLGTVGGAARGARLTLWGHMGTVPYATNGCDAIGSEFAIELPRGTVPASGNEQGGFLVLPDSTNRFRMVYGDEMTFSAWVKRRGLPYYGGAYQPNCFLGNATTGPAGGWEVYASLASTSWRCADLKVGSTTYYGGTRSATASVPTNEWAHFAIRVKTQGNYRPRFYINGTYTEVSEPMYSAYAYSITNALQIGATRDGYRSFNGSMDDVALWNTLLNHARIRSLYTVPTVVGVLPDGTGYNLARMTELWSLYDAKSGEQESGQVTWTYCASVPSGHVEGDTWFVEGSQNYYIQLGASDGLLGSLPPVGSLVVIR